MEELVPLIQSGHRRMEQAIAEYLADNQPSAEAQEPDDELTVGGARVQVSQRPEMPQQDYTPRGPRTSKEQARFDAIIAQYRRCGLLLAEPDDPVPNSAVRDEHVPAPEEDETTLSKLKKAADEAREEYARRAAARGARATTFGSRHSQTAVASARKHYERRKKDLLKEERDTALAAGVDAETFDRYAPTAAAIEAHKLIKEISYAQKLASKKWRAEDIHIHTNGKEYHAVPVLDEAPPLARMKRVWGNFDEDKSILSARNAALLLKRAAIVGSAPAALIGGALSVPAEVGLLVAGSGWAAGKLAKKIADYKPGYTPGRTVNWVLDREAEYERILFSAVSSARRGPKPERVRYNDAELTKAVGYAMVHADPENSTINHLDITIANTIDADVDRRSRVNTSKLAFQLGGGTVAATVAIAAI